MVTMSVRQMHRHLFAMEMGVIAFGLFGGFVAFLYASESAAPWEWLVIALVVVVAGVAHAWAMHKMRVMLEAAVVEKARVAVGRTIEPEEMMEEKVGMVEETHYPMSHDIWWGDPNR